jgi:UDP-GlcNAc:undecaprenyl-phosphate/decaprenyl-phosphate GlcNAc-1-phosphate transferase
MTLSSALSILFLSFFASITFNGLFRNLAKKNGILIDLPDKSRKFHFRATPLTGGISIFTAMIVTGLLLNGLTIVPVNYNTKDGMLKNADFSSQSRTKKYEVANKEYDVNTEIDKNSNSVKVDVGIVNQTISSVEITPNVDGDFDVLFSDGSTKVYSYENGQVKNISSPLEGFLSPLIKNSSSLEIDSASLAMFICGGFIVFFMIIDDFIGIRASIRLVFQALIAYLFILMCDESIVSLGNLFGFGDIELKYMYSIIFTIFCIVGLMNAFNMIDGLNGICASFALLPLVILMFFGTLKYGLLIPIGALIGFLAYNLGWFGKKRGVFLGDSGSNLLGFIVAVLCIDLSQSHQAINPVTALWLVAIPLLDCVGVMVSRLLKGVGPFKPGRDHLHHKLVDLGLTQNNILVLFITLSSGLGCIGWMLEAVFPNKEYLSFYSFILFAITYFITTNTLLKKNAQSI